ncbi:hypothetical protein EMIHUDRAFT_450577 [Emiliania huxleyi CCMP1516]|uniref:Hexosyltransferase n=2 Tax=Emiliania huxleyi TaxID=2903 RepID=A0A0D3JME2_EMIH1|nr:hypothetical protein EMIHUDRAFT_450577 [Emiliania huxleyi CCMP1516]EOD24677.1 hypothetical protein EMIHUDRAFT_450577 [Emiliania huxleyi CCMP1516]|eukprot:XP_005777106.1 hypothetical protein EMIHUDRAFT_450577 [Emiliania huxleyi CCMP1516]
MPACSKTLRSTRFNYTADSCPCSLGGCTSLWPCTASRLCFKHDLPSAAVAASHRAAALGSATASSDLDGDGGGRGSHGVTYLFFLSFNRSLVRNAFASNPWKARAREVNRVLWFMHTARAVGTLLPVHAVVAGDRDAASEAKLEAAGSAAAAGVRLLSGPMVPSPAWASKWHRLSFNKIAALSFTQFRKVVVLDNDVGLLRSMDHMLLHAPAPAAVFHTTIGPLAKRTPCAVTTGLLVLRPSQRAFARALSTLAAMNYSRETYDGGDEEFWLRYFADGAAAGEPLYELPWRYHTHRLLPLPPEEWYRVRMLHLIGSLAGRGFCIPRNATRAAEMYPTWTTRTEKWGL